MALSRYAFLVLDLTDATLRISRVVRSSTMRVYHLERISAASWRRLTYLLTSQLWLTRERHGLFGYMTSQLTFERRE